MTTDFNFGDFNAIKPLLSVPGTILVAGAYRGDYLLYFSQQFPSARLFGYEPQTEMFDQARRRLGRKAALFNYGLGTAKRTVMGGRCGSDGSSALVTDGKHESWLMRDAVEVIHEISPALDLLVLNCEGGEWALLPYLLDEMMHHRIASIALQQHTQFASPQRIARVLDYLREYYDCILDDGKKDGWSFWRRK